MSVVKELMEVPVEGGALTVGVWGGAADDAPVVLAVHGITASHLSWAGVAEELAGEVRLVAPDLRGRGGSASLPGPFGMEAHARDMVAVADYFGVERPVVVGHSMGAYVAEVMAAEYPARVGRVLMVDGGVVLPVPEGMSTEDALQAIIGPALARLSMTFESREAYHGFWRAHPALGPWWSPLLEEYIDYDTEGTEPELRSRVSRDAVIEDSEYLLRSPKMATAVSRSQCTIELLRAERGMLDNPEPLVPDALVPDGVVDLGVVPDTNHYTISLAPHGAVALADAIRKAVAAA